MEVGTESKGVQKNSTGLTCGIRWFLEKIESENKLGWTREGWRERGRQGKEKTWASDLISTAKVYMCASWHYVSCLRKTYYAVPAFRWRSRFIWIRNLPLREMMIRKTSKTEHSATHHSLSRVVPLFYQAIWKIWALLISRKWKQHECPSPVWIMNCS